MNAMSRLACIVVTISALCTIWVSRTPAGDTGRLQQSMIWGESVPVGEQTYVVFRKRFELARQPATAKLRIFADSRYILWANGKYVARGPCRFDPIQPEYDVLNLTDCLRKGSNVLAVLVHHYHDGRSARDGYSPTEPWTAHPFNGRTMRHAPGLTAELEVLDRKENRTALRTDSSWRVCKDTRYRPSPISWSSIPDRIDARRDAGDWTRDDFDDSKWQPAKRIDGNQWGPLRRRSIPLLRETRIEPLTVVEQSRPRANGQSAYWIWTRERNYPAQKHPRWSAPEGERFFRRAVVLPETADEVTVLATADNEFDCYFNGQKIGENHGNIQSWTTMRQMAAQKHVRVGRNVIAIRATNKHYGKTSDPAGLLVVVTWKEGETAHRLVSDGAWKAMATPGDGWEQSDYDDSRWPDALALCPYPTGTWHDRVRNYLEDRERDFPSQQLSALVPLRMRAGEEIVIDAGQFVQAYTVLDFDADAGSQLRIEYAQRYFDTGRSPSGSRGHVNQYTARAGRQSYMSTDTFGFKYLVIGVTAGEIELRGLKVVNRLYPFEVVGRFESSEPLLDQIWQNSVNTVRTCSEDAYVDCAVRERTEWMADGYVQSYRVTRVALAGPAADGGPPRYGDPRLLRNLLRHIGQSRHPDGRVKAHHPSDRWDIHGYIEDYACLWIQAVREYYDFTGDRDLARELWPAMTAQLGWFLDRRSERGLIKARDFVYPASNPLCYKVCEGATLNAYVAGALRDAAVLAGLLEHTDQQEQYAAAAEKLREDINSHLWDDEAGAYSGGMIDGKKYRPTVPAALLCLHFDVAPPARRARARQWLLTHYRELGGLPYVYQFLLNEFYRIDTDQADQLALDLIRHRWARMAAGETKTVWEGFGPSENCHEAGSAPAYFLSAYVLGVRVERPIAKRRIVIEPRLADLNHAAGVVVTEFGPVPVSWRRDTGGALWYEFEIPKTVTALVRIPTSGKKATLMLDGETLVLNGQTRNSAVSVGERFIRFEVKGGKHRGSCFSRSQKSLN